MNGIETSRSLRRHQVIGTLMIAALFGGFGGWAALAQINGAVIGQARVVVENSVKKVQHNEGGIVSEILVRDGSRVKAGEPLIRLDQTETRANLEIIDAQLDELRGAQARLEAERDQAEEIFFPAEITSRLSMPNVKAAYQGQQNLFRARREARQGEEAQLRTKAQQLEEEISGMTAQRQAKEKQLAFIRQELTGVRSLEAHGLVTLNRILTLEREQARLEGERGELIAAIAGKRGEIGETGLRIIQIEKNQNSEIVSDLRDTQGKINELLERRLAAEMRLKRTEIRAPRSGIVHQLNVHTVGGVISPGEVLMEIVPQADGLVFEAGFAPSDIDRIHIGQKARIRLNAFEAAVTPELNGEVAMVSPDAIVDQRTGASHYLVRIRIGKGELARLEDKSLMPGMLAEVFIGTGERTALSYLMKPLADRVSHAFRER
ncbi:MAG TPA: HlyD family type I secretion periplasmic adaptor subunit [Hyphomicrobiales bacterium]|nr:HlyD family type I secretion periplasmic adaptor subunit [Hyphomicrobiales bacterium]